MLESIAGLHNLKNGEIIFHNPKKNKPVTFFHKTLKDVKDLAKKGAFHYENGEKVDLKDKSDKEIRTLVDEGKILFTKTK